MEYRIVVVGGGAVGKTAITVRFVSGTFVQKYDPTIEDSYRKQVEIDGRACILDIMDTAGQEEYTALRDTYMITGDGFVLGYSITSIPSFEAAAVLRNNIVRIKGNVPDTPIMLVGNKCDLESERVVPTEEGRKTAEKWGTGFIEASAKIPKNVTEIFTGLVRLIDKWRENHPNMRPEPPRPKKTFCILL
jgi:small GTP-binding protein